MSAYPARARRARQTGQRACASGLEGKAAAVDQGPAGPAEVSPSLSVLLAPDLPRVSVWAGNSRCCKAVCCGSCVGSSSESSPAAAGAPPPGRQPHTLWTSAVLDLATSRFSTLLFSQPQPCIALSCPVSFGSPSAHPHQPQPCSGSPAVELWPRPLPRQR